MTVNWDAVAAVLDAITWPLTVIMAVLVLKKPLVEGLPSLLGRATKITLRDLGIELSPAMELAPTWSTANIDVRRLTSSDVFDSASMSLFQQLSEPSATDYAIVDLGLGDKWLSSRLFIFAVVLGQVVT